jgi:hypothetical protein
MTTRSAAAISDTLAPATLPETEATTGAVGRPGLDRSWQGVSLLDQRHQIAADAEQSAARGKQHRSHVGTLADFGNAQVEFAAKLTVNGIAAVGLIEHDMCKAVVDGAIKRLCRYCQIHRFLPCCRKPFVGPIRQIDRSCFSFCTEA